MRIRSMLDSLTLIVITRQDSIAQSPRKNDLPVAIQAGEKNYGKGHVLGAITRWLLAD